MTPRQLRLALLAAMVLPLVACIPLASAQTPLEVSVELHVISFGNFDVNKGTYTMDFYLHLWHANSTVDGLDATRFEFINGRAASRELLSDDVEDGQRHLWYRIQANLYTDPHFELYPYDTQVLRLNLEDAIHTADELRYVPRLGGNGLDPDVRVAGWHIDEATATVAEKEYRFRDSSETYSRFSYEVHVSRPPMSATLRSFLPPLAFVLVASFSFFLDPAQPVPRLTLGTGMLISAVGFHLSQMVNLPGLSVVTPFDRFMIASYAFIACCIMVTVALAWGEKLRIPAGILKLTNRWGAALTVAIPALVYVLLIVL